MTQRSYLLSDEKLEQIAAGKLWDFHGGVHPIQNKVQSNQTPIVDAGIPKELIIAVEQKGHIPELLVNIGDYVLKGQPLTKVYGALVVQHASSSGTVKAIEPRTDCHPSGLPALSIVIKTDGLDKSITTAGFSDYQNEMPATLIEAVQQAGIVGLGGAGFATHLKLTHSENRLLVVNAIECEPYITSDDRLVQEYSEEIIHGTQILQHILKPNLIVFAIEDNKPEAIRAFTLALEKLSEVERSSILLRVIPTRYPSGSAKQLIEVLTGEQTPINKHSSELGIIMSNVGTVFAVKEAIIDGKPLVSRIVTITGDAFARKGNARVRIGTPIQYLLDTYKLNSLAQQKLIVGGPMMGFTVNDASMPVTKICNCILAPTIKEAPKPEPEMSCIRCSECAEACPVELLPQQLLWYSQSEDHKKLEEYDLSACIECGACAFVCPSHIPLVEYYRVSKAQIKTAKVEADKAAIARKRHEDREQRLETEKQQRQLKHKQAAEKRQQQMKDNNNGEDLVAAALARAKAKKQSSIEASTEAEIVEKPTAQNSQVAAAIARAKAKKLAAQENSTTESEVKKQAKESTDVDPKKAAVATAIARAKAKKLAQQENSQAEVDVKTEIPVSTELDPKKAAVAAAIARAKAKKLALQENAQAEVDVKTEIPTSTELDPKKAAIAAAIARAKAKKLALQENVKPEVDIKKETPVSTELDPKKAAIAAAIARAKAKKLALQENVQPEVDIKKETPVLTELDPKKAAIAAAIERAKAKKLTSSENKVRQVNTLRTDESDNTEVIKQRVLRKEQTGAVNEAPLNSEIQEQLSEPTNEIVNKSTLSDNDAHNDKKAKIAAVIAKAKAKKLAEKDQ